ncbi:hypothetical protein GCM10007147_13210 [Nocardiopsis kunsanensis]|uniref:Uncharacterized protein n=1 Tax=Nocardiopsis kunsanensis TaxID=141693 RepID=A0A918X9Y0_9ACTN|nr:hypothetical protein GCM10007147_13210 [Nocardiopsis kunsanensis]
MGRVAAEAPCLELGRRIETYVRPGEQAFEATRTELHLFEPINDFSASFAIGLHMPTILNPGRVRRW